MMLSMWVPNFKLGYIFAGVYVSALIAALLLYPDSWLWWASAYAFHFLIFGFGVSFGLHRAIAHRMAPPNVRTRAAALVGALANVGSPIDFLLTHRAHHRFSDGEFDPQNRALLGWRLLFGMRRASRSNEPLTDLVEAREELREPYFLWLHRNYYLILLGYILAVYISFGVKGMLFLALIPSGLSFFALGALNYFGHSSGSHPTPRNIAWLFPLIFFECWHGDHHSH